MDSLYYLAKLHLDSNHEFDNEILVEMESVLATAKVGMSEDETKIIEEKLSKLTSLVKSLLDYEWALLKIEARIGGRASEVDKDKMAKKFLIID